jgi:hypothetical protein
MARMRHVIIGRTDVVYTTMNSQKVFAYHRAQTYPIRVISSESMIIA